MLTDNTDPIDVLLVKVLLKEASEAEVENVTRWLEKSAENQAYFRHFQLIWEQSHQLAPRPDIAPEDAWERFKQRVDHPVVPVSSVFFTWQRIAAAVVLLVGIGTIAYLNWRPAAPGGILLTSDATTVTDTLPDGSVVHLNRRSELSYSEEKKTVREAFLKGEAFFEISPDAEKPFVIRVNDVIITVLGTSFNVKGSVSKTEVIVATGQVRVETSQKKIKVYPSEMVTAYTGQVQLLKQKQDDAFYSHYFTNPVYCSNTPLQQLVEVLSVLYTTPIVLENPFLRNKAITTVIDKTKPLAENLEMINQTMGTTAIAKGDTIFLK